MTRDNHDLSASEQASRDWCEEPLSIDYAPDPKPARERKVFPEDFPEGLKPRLRLFLSVDLVGSTPYKQSRQIWRPEILSFYRNFDYILQAQYRAFSEGRDNLPAPEFWKSNGDELLYACELQDLNHAHAVMHVWLAALNEYRALDAGDAVHLDVKSTAWIGLFPVPNSEVFFRRGMTQQPLDNVNDAILVQADIRDEWYSKRTSHLITRDFVGPSIDTGFRLTSWASPDRLIVSVDLAFLLTGAYAKGIGPLRLHLSGKDKLRGVIDNQPYPTIWIPVGSRNRLDSNERRRGEISTDRTTIRSYCEATIEQNYKSITPLSLAGGYEDFDWVPPYILNRVIKHWKDEARRRVQLRGVAPAAEDAV
jgi:hypothetical protein